MEKPTGRLEALDLPDKTAMRESLEEADSNFEDKSTCMVTPTLDATSVNTQNSEVAIAEDFGVGNAASKLRVHSHPYLTSFEHISCDLESDGGQTASEKVDFFHTERLSPGLHVGATSAT